MNVRVKFFAMTRDIVGTSELSVEIPERATTSELLDSLIKQYPKLTQWKQYVRVAVNHEYVLQEQVLSQGDEVAIIPPVSGG